MQALGLGRPVGPEGQESLPLARAVFRGTGLGKQCLRFDITITIIISYNRGPNHKAHKAHKGRTKRFASVLPFCDSCGLSTAAPGSPIDHGFCRSPGPGCARGRRSWSGQSGVASRVRFRRFTGYNEVYLGWHS